MDVIESLNSLNRHTNQDELDLQESEDASRRDEAAAVPIGSAPHTSAFTNQDLQYHFQTGSSDAQAAVQNSYSDGGRPAAEAIGVEPRITYLTTSAVSGTNTPGALVYPADLTHSHTAGKLFVMTTPDVLQPGVPLTLAPPTQPYNTVKMGAIRAPRDDRRKTQHNEVERRRRDKINTWIVMLSKIIPDCNMDDSKSSTSKGGILSKACDYIQELRESNNRLQQSLPEMKRLQMDNEVLRRQVVELKNENALLRAELLQRAPVADAPSL